MYVKEKCPTNEKKGILVLLTNVIYDFAPMKCIFEITLITLRVTIAQINAKV